MPSLNKYRDSYQNLSFWVAKQRGRDVWLPDTSGGIQLSSCHAVTPLAANKVYQYVENMQPHNRGGGAAGCPAIVYFQRPCSPQLTNNTYCSGRGFQPTELGFRGSPKAPEHAGKRRHQDPIGQASETVEKPQGSCLETYSALERTEVTLENWGGASRMVSFPVGGGKRVSVMNINVL